MLNNHSIPWKPNPIPPQYYNKIKWLRVSLGMAYAMVIEQVQMLPRIYQIVEIDDGFLAIMARPSAEWLVDDIKGLALLRVQVLTSLLTNEESYELGLGDENALCQTCGIEFISAPIPDRGTPENSGAISSLAEYLYGSACSGKGIVIHCRAGIGRSGLLAACVLLHHGLTVSEAFAMISRARAVSVPDTEEQAIWVTNHAKKRCLSQ